MTETKDKPELKPASENIWYALATIAGEPAGASDTEVIDKNRRYWNAYMSQFLTDTQRAELKDKDGQPLALPKLSGDMRGHIRKALNRRGFKDVPFPEPKQGSIDYSNTEFSLLVNFSGFVFTSPVVFSGAYFNSTAYFDGAIFLQTSSFKGAIFRNVIMDKLLVAGGIFKDTQFYSFSDFREAEFGGLTDFENSSFYGIVSFISAKFHNLSRFQKSEFFGMAHFQHSVFLGKANFNAAVFKTTIDFTKADFRKHPPEFYDAEISEDIRWDDTEFPKTIGVEDAISHKNAYERLSLMMSKLEKHHDRHKFFRNEMRVRRRLERGWKRWPARFVNWVYEISCDYGYGFSRALAWWFGHILAGTALLITLQGYRLDISGRGVVTALKLLGESFMLSYASAHSFLSLHRGALREVYNAAMKEIPAFHVIWLVQGVLGLVLLFFLLLTIRNKFKMG